MEFSQSLAELPVREMVPLPMATLFSTFPIFAAPDNCVFDVAELEWISRTHSLHD